MDEPDDIGVTTVADLVTGEPLYPVLYELHNDGWLYLHGAPNAD